MNKREKMILVLLPILVGVMLVVWAPSLLKMVSHKSTPKVKSYKQDTELSKIDDFIKNTGLIERSKMSQFEEWGKDPFYASAIEVPEAESWPLKGIFWREVNPSALIGEDIVEIGDKLGDFTVTNILPDMVVISDGRKVIKLIVGKSFPKP